jgi:hypothetical protein
MAICHWPRANAQHHGFVDLAVGQWQMAIGPQRLFLSHSTEPSGTRLPAPVYNRG